MSKVYKQLKHKQKMKKISWVIFVGGLVLGVLFVVTFLIINFPAIWQKTKYDYVTKIKKEDYSKEVIESEPKVSGESADKIAKSESRYKESHLYIPKIGVVAPIVFDVEARDVIPKLHDGVVQMKPSVRPGERGNVFITGHSSYYLWDWGKYNSIFALIDKLEGNDKIIIRYKGKTYIYIVKQVFVVKPKDVSVIESGEKNTLTLSTCTPVGTTINRLIVRAEEEIIREEQKTIAKKPEKQIPEKKISPKKTKKPSIFEGFAMLPSPK